MATTVPANPAGIELVVHPGERSETLHLWDHDATSAEPRRSASRRRPNILVFVTDDQRADTMAVMPKTRRWFKRGGTSFTNAHVTTPLCCPSRATIFTGRYAHNHRVRNNFSPRKLDQASTIQRYLQEVGYLTGISGKFLNAWNLEVRPRYFDRWAIMNGAYFNATFNVNGRTREIARYSTTFIREKALAFLRRFERRDKKPWLLFVTPYAPHGPFVPERRHRGAPVPVWTERSPATEEEDRTDKPPFVQERNSSWKRARKVRAKQLRTLMSVDDMVGHVMRRLQRLGEAKRTLAFFISDNGFFWAEHGLGDKRLPYWEALRVPLLLRWPGHVSAGGRDGRLVSNVDLAPTIRHAARIPVSRLKVPLDGRSLLRSRWSRENLLFEYWVNPVSSFPRWASVLADERQYTEYYGDGSVTFREVYDLPADPWQLDNLLRDADPNNDPSDAELDALSDLLSGYRRCSGTSGTRACP